MGADAALTTFEQGAGTVEDERPCSPCSPSVVQAALRTLTLSLTLTLALNLNPNPNTNPKPYS